LIEETQRCLESLLRIYNRNQLRVHCTVDQLYFAHGIYNIMAICNDTHHYISSAVPCEAFFSGL